MKELILFKQMLIAHANDTWIIAPTPLFMDPLHPTHHPRSILAYMIVLLELPLTLQLTPQLLLTIRALSIPIYLFFSIYPILFFNLSQSLFFSKLPEHPSYTSQDHTSPLHNSTSSMFHQSNFISPFYSSLSSFSSTSLIFSPILSLLSSSQNP